MYTKEMTISKSIRSIEPKLSKFKAEVVASGLRALKAFSDPHDSMDAEGFSRLAHRTLARYSLDFSGFYDIVKEMDLSSDEDMFYDDEEMARIESEIADYVELGYEPSSSMGHED